MKSGWKTYGFYGLVTVLALGIIGSVVYMMRAGGGTLPIAGQVQNFTADEVPDRTVSLNDLNGKIVLITWYYTHCTDECPLTMYRFEQIQDALKKQGEFGSKVVLVAVTLDPTRDTPPVIQQYAAHFNADLKGWYFLRESPSATIETLAKFGIQVKESTDSETIEHTSKTELIDQNGNIRATYDSANLDTKKILSDIHSLIVRESWA